MDKTADTSSCNRETSWVMEDVASLSHRNVMQMLLAWQTFKSHQKMCLRCGVTEFSP